MKASKYIMKRGVILRFEGKVYSFASITDEVAEKALNENPNISWMFASIPAKSEEPEKQKKAEEPENAVLEPEESTEDPAKSEEPEKQKKAEEPENAVLEPEESTEDPAKSEEPEKQKKAAKKAKK